jgi:hypothetical protein
MSAQAFTAPVSLQEVVERILASRQITRLDQQLLLSLSSLSGDEQNLINQVFDRLRSGLLKVVD